MARDLSPKWKRCRREKYSLFDDDKWKKRPTLPGQHGVSTSRPSSYAIRFREKQKLKRIYGLLERQFKRFFKIAGESEGNTGTRLLQLLELRLDNLVYRLGLAPTRSAARQLVNHGHITVNGKKVSIPSYIGKVGDEIYLKTQSQKKEFTKILAEGSKKTKVPAWLSRLAGGGRIKMEPSREMIDKGINEGYVVEYYSR
ncbi:MAG: 30S ribosomal protein S4 [Candidatus Dojkabacteria bacterium]|jgi:small subunit ribosomal protein S4|nr:30S ribosomal protein S4 [Candidatus Dojkabacteria bacterium]